MPTLIIAGTLVAFAVAAVVYTLWSQVAERQVVRESLRQLDGYEVDDVRDQELLDSLRHRVFVPAVDTLTSLGRRFTPTGYVDKVRRQFVYMGDSTADSVDRFLAIKVSFAIGGVLMFLLVAGLGVLNLSPTMRLVAGGLLAGAMVLGPDAWIARKVEERQKAIQITLPDILDLLTISVEAGLGFEQALDRVIASVPGPLTDEFSRMLGEVRAGASRADALRAMDDRVGVPELRSFVLAIVQADTFGVSIGRVLRAQSDEMRVRRRQAAQERAQKAPVKMLLPMVFCIFPALFVVVLGPAILGIKGGL